MPKDPVGYEKTWHHSPTNIADLIEHLDRHNLMEDTEPLHFILFVLRNPWKWDHEYRDMLLERQWKHEYEQGL
jgi:hypothetical protein